MAVHEPICVDGPAAEVGAHLLARLLARGLAALRAPTVLDLSFPRDWDGRLAYAISWIASPPVAAAVALGAAAAAQAVPGAWAWAGLYVALGIATPVVYLVWLARTGRVTDLDVQLRRQRARPLLFTLTCGALATALLALGGAPPTLTALAIALWLETALLFGITLRWKISVHCAAAASAATWVWLLTGTLWPLLVGVPLVAWSRVRLRRHTLPQTIAGALLGSAIVWSVLALVGGR